jgi:hypothetical protein
MLAYFLPRHSGTGEGCVGQVRTAGVIRHFSGGEKPVLLGGWISRLEPRHAQSRPKHHDSWIRPEATDTSLLPEVFSRMNRLYD